MSRLTVSQRNALPSSAFADPKNRSFPINDADHAKAAKMLSGYASSSTKANINRKAKKFSSIGQK